MTDQPTTLDRLAIVKALSRPTAMGIVIAANPHLTKARVEAIAADAGHPRINDLRAALVRLQVQVDTERMAKAVHTGPTEASKQGASARTMAPRPAAAPNQGNFVSPRPAQVASSPQPYEPTAQLLLEARDSGSKRTIALAHKVEDLLVDLRDRLRGEAQARRNAEQAAAEKRRQKARAAAEKKRRAEEADQARQAAIAEVRRIEEQLKAAREKVRGFKNHPGGNGRAQVVASPSSESRQPGGTAQADALRRRHAYYADFMARMAVPDATVRQWAAANGHQVGKFGLMGRAILDAYEQAHPTQAAS